MGSNSPKGHKAKPLSQRKPFETSISQNESQITQFGQMPAENEIRKAHAVKSSTNGLPSVDEAVYYLKIRVWGRKVDVDYTAYCAAIIREYLAKRDRVSYKTQLAVMKGAMAMHIATLNAYPWDMSAVRKYNDSISQMNVALAENTWTPRSSDPIQCLWILKWFILLLVIIFLGHTMVD